VCATVEQVSRSAVAQEHPVVIATNTRDASLCSRILAIGRATPACRVSQAESFRISRYERDGVRRVFLNSGIDFRHFYFEQEPRLDETSDELNARYLRGAVETGCRAAATCLDVAGLSPRDVDLLVVCTSTGTLLDLNMLVMNGGRERTEEEFRQLFDAAGLQITRLIPTLAPQWVIEATRRKAPRRWR
jgi:hypothetical protein